MPLLFKAMGTNINYQGGSRKRSACQACEPDHDRRNVIRCMQALTYAKAKGLDLQTVPNSVSTGAAGSKQLVTFGTKILAGDYAGILHEAFHQRYEACAD